jgi:hypothetical protein
MTALTEYAAQLKTLFIERKSEQITLSHAEQDLEARKLALTPKDGWLSDKSKSNEEQRRAEAERTFASDEKCKNLVQIISARRDALAELEAQIEALQEQASAERWRIREVLAQALAVRTQGERVEDAAPGAPEFDQGAQSAADDEFPFA